MGRYSDALEREKIRQRDTFVLVFFFYVTDNGGVRGSTHLRRAWRRGPFGGVAHSVMLVRSSALVLLIIEQNKKISAI